MKLYWGSGSPYAWRAMLALIAKGVEFDDQLLEFSKREHKAPEYLALNPRGRVPTLVDGDTVVYESLAIMAYIDRKVPETPLFGRTPEETARVFRIVSEHDSYTYPTIRAALGPVFRGTVDESADELREAAVKIEAELASLRASLGEGPWLAGDSVSAADLVVYPTLMLLDRVLGKPELRALELGVDTFAEPGIAAWKARLEALPGVARAHPPHWSQ